MRTDDLKEYGYNIVKFASNTFALNWDVINDVIITGRGYELTMLVTSIV